MKLRYLFLATVAACVLPSCSDDSNNGIELPDDTMVEANISMIAAPQGDTMTTGTHAGTEGERFIGKLTAYVFYDNDAFAGMGTAESLDGKSVDEIRNIVVKVKAKGKGQLSEPTKFKMVLLANVSLGKTPAALSDITNDASFSGIAALNAAGAGLPMYSQVINIEARILAGSDYNNWVLASAANVRYTDQAKQTLVNSGEDWTGTGNTYEAASGDRIELTRHVARIQLESLTANFTGNYAGASFTLKKVCVANASDNSMLYTAAGNDYGLEMVGDFLHGCEYVRDDYFLVSGATLIHSLAKDYDEGLKVSNDVSPLTDNNKPHFYVFELSNKNPMRADEDNLAAVPADRKINTMLILEGEWKYAGGRTDTRYYRIPIRATEGATAELGVVHNTIYKVSAILTGEGSTNPDTEDLNACVSFKVKVEDWKVISQTETD